jgi:5-methylcytosine-specific restriction endonuclease McrA
MTQEKKSPKRFAAIRRAVVGDKLAQVHGWACWYCREPLRRSAKRGDPDMWELDHIVARTKGGTSRFDNLALACVQCNRAKQNLTLADFWRWLKKPKFLMPTLTERL